MNVKFKILFISKKELKMNKHKIQTTFIIIFSAVIFLISSDLKSQTIIKRKSQVSQVQQIKPLPKLKLPDLTVSFRSRIIKRNTFRGLYGSSDITTIPGGNPNKGISVLVTNIGDVVAKNFFVDIVLSTDTNFPIKFASYSPNFCEDVLLKGGRLSVKNLKPGASTSLRLPKMCKIPDNTPLGNYYLCAVVDPGKKILEKNEKNNTAYIKFKVLCFIDHIGQTGYWPGASGSFELSLYGSGFGDSIGNKIVRVGTYSFVSNNMEYWSKKQIIVCLPNNFPFGTFHDIWITKNGKTISNKKKHVLIYMDLESGMFTDGNGNPISAQANAGAIIGLDGIFSPTQDDRHVKFGNVHAQVKSWNSNIIKIRVPNLPPSQYDVYIERNGMRISFKVKFRIIPN